MPSCPKWPSCGCGTQSGPHGCEWMKDKQDAMSAETPQQVAGAFLMHLGQAPWDAEELLGWLASTGYKIVKIDEDRH